MKFIIGAVIVLVTLFFTVTGVACCKISGDAEEDAERCFEEWLKSKRGEDSAS